MIADNQRGVYWRGGDEWGARRLVDVTPAVSTTEARLEIELPGLLASGYRLKLWVYDNASQEVIRRLTFQSDGDDVVDPGPDVTAPLAVIDSPVGGSTLGAPFVMSGRVTDDRGVAEVRLVIKNQWRNEFWNGSGWQRGWIQVPAELAAPGTASTTWSYSFAGPVPRSKLYLSARAVDTAGTRQDPPSWITVRTP